EGGSSDTGDECGKYDHSHQAASLHGVPPPNCGCYLDATPSASPSQRSRTLSQDLSGVLQREICSKRWSALVSVRRPVSVLFVPSRKTRICRLWLASSAFIS